ncbi:hypothetical protein B0H15DRAFT_802353 [Mycena belliarum]|uniref:Uncharacterized protein n=1 Tax=Mycena belliarum TaxID=1033014 RepID=A0AAD6U1G7_9AGAR|nr:hypothetical protein B0H15DRAFT_802353 [Mycena belliae]
MCAGEQPRQLPGVNILANHLRLLQMPQESSRSPWIFTGGGNIKDSECKLQSVIALSDLQFIPFPPRYHLGPCNPLSIFWATICHELVHTLDCVQVLIVASDCTHLGNNQDLDAVESAHELMASGSTEKAKGDQADPSGSKLKYVTLNNHPILDIAAAGVEIHELLRHLEESEVVGKDVNSRELHGLFPGAHRICMFVAEKSEGLPRQAGTTFVVGVVLNTGVVAQIILAREFVQEKLNDQPHQCPALVDRREQVFQVVCGHCNRLGTTRNPAGMVKWCCDARVDLEAAM